MNETSINALEIVAERGTRLRTQWRLDWPETVQEAVCRLRLEPAADHLPSLAAIVGGASSGKSTVFNNLLDGHLVSRITARGHVTLGPILAVHERHRPAVERLLGEGKLLPGIHRVFIDLDENATGEPDTIAVSFHTIDSLREVLLFDLPDFTSEHARQEGDIALRLLPWFDRIVVVVDHERWFDRQSISMLRAQSAPYGQQRWVLFNRTRESPLCNDDRAALAQQAERLGSDGMSILEFRRGRGFCLFPPGMLEDVGTFVSSARPQRTEALLTVVADGANRVLNLNEERAARLDELHQSALAAVRRATPSARDVMVALMNPSERKQLDLVSRVLRIRETKRWLGAQTRRLQSALKQVPLVGAVVGGSGPSDGASRPDHADRLAIAWSYFETVGRGQVNEVNRTVRSSSFWDEIRRWTSLEPTQRGLTWDPVMKEEVQRTAGALEKALARWIEKVEAECQGVSPHITGAVGFSAVGLALVLIAAPGPVAALTLVSAKGAIGAALTQLIAAAGTGAIVGRPMGRLIAVVQEKLLGCPEFDVVQATAASFHDQLEVTGRTLVSDVMTEARALVMDGSDPLATALEQLRKRPEGSP